MQEDIESSHNDDTVNAELTSSQTLPGNGTVINESVNRDTDQLPPGALSRDTDLQPPGALSGQTEQLPPGAVTEHLGEVDSEDSLEPDLIQSVKSSSLGRNKSLCTTSSPSGETDENSQLLKVAGHPVKVAAPAVKVSDAEGKVAASAVVVNEGPVVIPSQVLRENPALMVISASGGGKEEDMPPPPTVPPRRKKQALSTGSTIEVVKCYVNYNSSIL